MNTLIIDRRKNTSGKSLGNRQRFLRRVEGQIQKALPDVIGGHNIRDLGASGGKVKVKIKGIREPRFIFDPQTGKRTFTQPGNDRFNSGDHVGKPPKQQGSGSGQGGSKDAPMSEDDFIVTITKEEFWNYFFADLELPRLVKQYLESEVTLKQRRAGFSADGNPSRLDAAHSFKQSLGRRIGMLSVLKKKLEELEKQLARTTDANEQKHLQEEIERVQKQMTTIPFIDHVDLRYRNYEMYPVPTTQAVMFCIMDVSGSMGQHEKDIAKRFFTLLYIFLTKQYEKIDIVYIRHHTEAKEVDEEEFFHSRESGGTVVAPALQLCSDIIAERYSYQWNVYICQASDGDVWGLEDARACGHIVETHLLPAAQFMAYIEISQSYTYSQLWDAYTKYTGETFAERKIYQPAEIWPVFRDLFRKKELVEERGAS